MTRQMDRIQKRNILNISRVGVAGRPMGIRRFLSHYNSTANEIKLGVLVWKRPLVCFVNNEYKLWQEVCSIHNETGTLNLFSFNS